MISTGFEGFDGFDEFNFMTRRGPRPYPQPTPKKAPRRERERLYKQITRRTYEPGGRTGLV